MSEFMGKAIGTFGKLFSNVGLANPNDSQFKHKSLNICNKTQFLAKLRNASSKKEEEMVVNSFLTAAEKHLSEPNVSESQIESIVHMVLCCQSLGYQAPFIYVHCIKLAQKGNICQKNTGYSACASLLHPNHELIILLINGIQKDLESSNPAEIILGLKSVCNVINAETIHNVFHLVLEKLNHQNIEVRKIASHATNVCLRLANSESAYQMALPKLEQILTSSDLSAVASVVPVIYNIVKNCPNDYSYLVDCLIQIQNQILQRRCPRHMDHHGVPSPWLQIELIRFFSLLCQDSLNSLKIYPILKATLTKAELNHNIAYAIIAEVIECIATITSSDEMIQLALSAATKFLNSDDGNLKFVGVQSFTRIMKKLKPSLDAQHHESIIACLNHPDDMLKTKTLELLYNLANPSNAQAVCKKLFEFMLTTSDIHSKRDLGLKTLEIANQYHSNNEWYIATVNKVLLEVGDLVSDDFISEIIAIIHQDVTGSLKTVAKLMYKKMCQNTCPSTSIIKIMCSVFDELSECGEVISQLLNEGDETTCLWILISLRNELLTKGYIAPTLHHILMTKHFNSKILCQIQSEIRNILHNLEDIQIADTDIKVDPSLSFLDNYVCEQLVEGKPCYKTARLRVAEFPEVFLDSSISSATNTNKASVLSDLKKENTTVLSYSSLSSSSLSTSFSQDVPYNLPKKKTVWTKDGRLLQDKTNIAQENTASTSLGEDANLFAGL